MASISSPPSFPSLRKFSSISPPLISFSSSHHPLSNSIIPCRCLPQDSLFHQAIKNVTETFQDFVKFYRKDNNNNNNNNVKERKDVEEWDWDKWMEYITKLEEQEEIVTILKVKLGEAVCREDFEEAARFKVGIAAAGANDIVGRVISQLNRAVEEERYEDAAFFRDNASAGLKALASSTMVNLRCSQVGWWAGISEGSDDPYGRIIHINAEHGRYVARSYSPRQLATAKPGAPLFEVFLTTDDKGDYKQLVVYLKGSRGKSEDSFTKSSLLSDQSSDLNPLIGLAEGQSGLSAPNTEDIENSEEEDDDSDLAEGMTGLPNMMPDVIPDVKVKLWRVTGTGKVDKGPISKVDEQVSEEDEEEDVFGDSDMVNVEAESNNDTDEILIDSAGGISDNYGNRNEIVVKIVFGGLLQKLTNQTPSRT
ncbi:hypothetical protein IFM89_010436 [Coptis chinensis]|uniref:Uncharacterized protein n=1 Tax=Coptis chinensis TaxID=261450 RepID=A0A835I2U8_9MAGN|nr:hypothetical protein IFM89_010436 [Coptis chinensis]